MSWLRPVISAALLVALLVGVACLSEPAFGQKKKKKKKKGSPPAAAKVADSDPRLKSLRGDLEAVFRHWDSNRDDKVSAAELAVGFRGKGAVPYRPATPDEKPSPGVRELKLPEIAKKYPDYNFMLHWDKDRDDAVTSREYAAFVDETAAHYRVIFEKMDALEHLQKQLTVKGINASRKANIKAQMKILNTQLATARAGFRHQLSIDYIAKARALRRTDWLWYRAASASLPR